MTTRIDLDETLVKKAMQITGQDTRKAAVTTILDNYVRWYEQQKLLKLRGTKIWTDR